MSNPTSNLEILSRLELYFSIRHTARTLRRFAEVLDFDYDCVVIFLSVAEVCFQSAFHLAPIESGEIDVEKIYSSVAQAGLSIMTIGEITGIPRETVRRKVKKLIDEKVLALSDATKNVYIPASVVVSERFYSRFEIHVIESEQFVKTIKFYQREL